MERPTEFSPYKEAVTNNKIYLPSKVSLTLFLSPHMDREDLGDIGEFRRKLRRADICLIERVGWNPDTLLIFTHISRGNREALNFAKEALNDETNTLPGINSWNFALFDALYASNRIVGIVDAPEGSKLAKEAIPQIEPEDIYRGSFADTLKFIELTYEKLTGKITERDIYVLENLGPYLESIIKNSSRLQNKSQVEVFMIFGSLHFPLFSVLERITESKRAETGSKLPAVSLQTSEDAYDPGSALSMHFLPYVDYHLEDEQVKLMCARILASSDIRKGFNKPIREKVLAQIVQSLSLEEIAEFFSYNKAYFETRESKEPPDVLLKILGAVDARGKEAYYSQ